MAGVRCYRGLRLRRRWQWELGHVLMQRLGDDDTGRQGMLPTKKEVVEAMPTVEVTAVNDSAGLPRGLHCRRARHGEGVEKEGGDEEERHAAVRGVESQDAVGVGPSRGEAPVLGGEKDVGGGSQVIDAEDGWVVRESRIAAGELTRCLYPSLNNHLGTGAPRI
ncbi:hypothetical protein E2562_008237 [Oryza meyeriana var. granulata]|uniref:Uncharacterized protein n=1 Tax=Oryza meyeriana var. granulata TaxID=110450 RepID=A0A6G1DG17_9ORYZ|nr:hypothetical protein E2562_008237 [Oryza meyeriana var. granulata]